MEGWSARVVNVHWCLQANSKSSAASNTPLLFEKGSMQASPVTTPLVKDEVGVVKEDQEQDVASAASGDSQDSDVVMESLTVCTAPGCNAFSLADHYNSMSLRMGFPMCTNHLDDTAIEECLVGGCALPDMDKVTYVFYNLQTSHPESQDITQIAAVSDKGAKFKQRIVSPFKRSKGSSRPGHSEQLSDALSGFAAWLIKTHYGKHGEENPVENMVLVAHHGACFHHELLIKALKEFGIKLPNFRVADTVLIAKVKLGADVCCKLPVLVEEYVPKFEHNPHDARSNALALFKVMKRLTPFWKDLIWALGTPLGDYVSRLGFTPSKIICAAEAGTSPV